MVLIMLTCVTMLSTGAGAGTEGLEFGATQRRILDTSDVDISLVNHTSERIELFGGGIYSLRTGDRVARLSSEQRFLRSGDEQRWTWASEGRVGRFVARFRTSGGKVSDRFEKGAYFTLGFDGSDHRFTVWVRETTPIAQLREDLAKAQEERRIVSGIVRRRVTYNPDWSYSMGPGTIVLGDVFTEVCDASPTYVERHRRAWMGDRWCPWSSYVATEGR